MHPALAAALATAATADEVARVVFEQGLAAFEADAGVLVVADDEPGWLRIASHLGYPEVLIASWRRFPTSLASPVTDALGSGVSVWVESFPAAMAGYPEWASAVQGMDDHAGTTFVVRFPKMWTI